MQIEPIKLFCSYSHKDEDLQLKLKSHLSLLERAGIAVFWHDRDITTGQDLHKKIEYEINTAQAVLLLLSDNFIDSDYCWEKEMKIAWNRRIQGKIYLIPVMLRPLARDVLFSFPIGRLQFLPKDAKPVTKFGNRDEAYAQIVEGIKAAIKQPLPEPETYSTAFPFRSEPLNQTVTHPEVEEKTEKTPPQSVESIRDEARLTDTLAERQNSIINFPSCWIVPKEYEKQPKWVNVEFRYGMGQFRLWELDPWEHRGMRSDNPDVKQRPGHKQAELSFEDRKQMGIEWPGVVYKVGSRLCVTSRSIQEYSLWVYSLARSVENGAISNSSARLFWRTLDVTLPKYLRLDEDRSSTELPSSDFSRWIEFFVFGNPTQEGLNGGMPERLLAWKALHRAIVVSGNPYRINHPREQ